MKSAVANGYISQQTADEIIKQASQRTIEQQLQIGMLKVGIANTIEQTEMLKAQGLKLLQEAQKITTERQQSWDRLNLYEREVIVKEAMQRVGEEQMEFNTSTAARVKQWTDIVTGMTQAGTGVFNALKP